MAGIPINPINILIHYVDIWIIQIVSNSYIAKLDRIAMDKFSLDFFYHLFKRHCFHEVTSGSLATGRRLATSPVWLLIRRLP